MPAVKSFRRYAAHLIAAVLLPALAVTTGCRDNPVQPVTEQEEPVFFTSGARQQIVMVSLPGGSFLMGSDSGRTEEGPPHTVNLDPFRISAAEITNNLFAEFLNNARSAGRIMVDTTFGTVIATSGEFRERLVADLNTLSSPEFHGPILYSGGVFTVKDGWRERPAVRVTWYGATLFAEYRGMRLPTEAEWEYAAGGGAGYQYATAGGKLSQENAWNGRDEEYPVQVRSYAPNPFGLYDMTGNAAEWCLDWFSLDYYGRSPAENPLGPEGGFYRVVRGGNWKADPFILRNSYRWYESPQSAEEDIGFRVVQPYP